MNKNVIEVRELNKSFGNVHAVKDLSFRVKRGELFAFLGVNGAGKSTTISILCGQLGKDSGEVQIHGADSTKAGLDKRYLLGLVFQDSVLDKPLTVKENLKSRAALYGITGEAFDDRLKELIELLKFDDYLNRPVGKLSGGQRRRIDIARALLHRPEILILDEPLSGVDAEGIHQLLTMLDEIRTKFDLSIFMVTHDFAMLSRYVDKVVLLKETVLTQGTPEQVLSSPEFRSVFHMAGGEE